MLAGWLFDRTQGYATAMMIAAGVSVLGVWVAKGLPRSRALPPGESDAAKG